MRPTPDTTRASRHVWGDPRSMANAIDVQKYLSGVDYPAGRDDLVRHAEGAGAPDDVLDLLRGIEDRSYDGPSGVSSQLSGES